ncbi:MAG: DUF1501 domain-containing protein [Planctomycetales bacterium]|nr:DUF1501 domain-containing protein [Planctomycetales bacterium]
MKHQPASPAFLPTSRRDLLRGVACGFGSLAMAGLCQNKSWAATGSPLAPKPTHHPARAKRVIFVFMQGGPSHVDTFDHKPMLAKHDGEKIDFFNARSRVVRKEPVMKSPWKFRPYGECGHMCSELFPEIAQHVDDLCFIHSMQTEGVAHGPATLFLHTGATNLIRPSVGAWVTYGLGTANQSLPGFITINPPPTKGGPRNYSNAFLPSAYQGTAIGRPGVSIREARIRNTENPQRSLAEQREQLDLLQAMNRLQLDRRAHAEELESVIESYELAFRMQMEAPGVFDLSDEPAETLAQYGIGEKATDEFGRQCLLARRLAEADVRYIQINYSDNGATPRWDQHSKIQQHAVHAKATDKPVAGLLADLKRRGLLEDTLVWWGGEFGRTPFTQGNDGRDHNPKGFTVWLAGGGVKRGFAHGATDEFGDSAVENRVHMHDLHATVLHLLGMDHERLTYRLAGRDFRLTDIAGRVVNELFA